MVFAVLWTEKLSKNAKCYVAGAPSQQFHQFSFSLLDPQMRSEYHAVLVSFSPVVIVCRVLRPTPQHHTPRHHGTTGQWRYAVLPPTVTSRHFYGPRELLGTWAPVPLVLGFLVRSLGAFWVSGWRSGSGGCRSTGMIIWTNLRF